MSIPKFQVQKNLTPPATIAISGSPDYVGTYGSGTTYATGDVVTYNGSSYVARQATTGNTPGDTAYWQTLASQGGTGAQGPTGAQGIQGIQGNTGATGSAATVAVGSTSSVANDGTASVTNAGSSSAATLNFVLRDGPTGATGAPGVIQTVTAGTNLNGGGSAATVTVNLDSDISVNSATFAAASPLVFEGATANDYETTVAVTDPTADRTVTIPDGSGTIAYLDSNITGNAATATALQTARTIGGVSFDGTGNINLPGVNTAGNQDTSGNATTATTAATATTATNVTATANNTADETVYLAFVDGATGSQGVETDTGLNYNPSTGVLTTTSVTGNLTGNVTGNVSGSAGSATGNAATATALQTARTIGGVSFDGTGNIDLPGVNTAGNQNTSGSSASTTGNAATATALETARTIGGVSFDGTANINLAGVNTAGNQDTSGNSATATALATARNINGVSFDGTGDITVTAAAGTLTGTELKSTVVTSSLTSVGTLSALTVSGTVTMDSVGITAVQTSSESFADNDTSLMTSAAIDDRINAAGGGGAAGSNTQVQYNSSGSFAGSANLTFDGSTLTANAFSGPLTGDVTGNVSGTAATVTGAAQSNITSVGTLSSLTLSGAIDGPQDFTVGNGEGELILFQGSSNYVYFQAGGSYRAYFAGSDFLPYTNGGTSLGNSSKYWAGLYSSTWVRISGTTGVYFQTYAGGLHMEDSTWIRTYTGTSKGLLSEGGMAGVLSGTSSLSGYQYLVRGTTYANFAYYTSSRKTKDQIETFSDSGDVIDALRPVSFIEKFRADTGINGDHVETNEEKAIREADLQYGFVAEEIAENSVTEKLGQYDTEFEAVGWKWPDLIAVLTAEVKSLRQRVSTLEGG